MEEITFAIQMHCPDQNGSIKYIVSHVNTTKYSDPFEQIPHIVCELAKHNERMRQYIEGSLAYQLLIGSIITFIGSAFSILVFKTTKFTNERFFYCRASAFAELVHAIFMFLRYYVSDPKKVIKNLVIAIYSAHFYVKMELFVTTFMNLISLWVSFRQWLAGARPNWIPRLNSRRLIWIVTLGIMLVSVLAYVPFAVIRRAEFNETRQQYEIINWLRSDAIVVDYRRILGYGDYLIAFAFLISSCVATRTYRRAAFDLASLKDIASDPPFFEESLKIRNAEMKMYASVFEASETICLSMIAALMAILRTMDIETSLHVVLAMSYSDAEANLWRASVHYYLIWLQNFLYILVHSTQFSDFSFSAQFFETYPWLSSIE